MYKIGLTKGIVMCRLMNLRSLSIMGPNIFQMKLCWKLKVEEILPFGPTGAAKLDFEKNTFTFYLKANKSYLRKPKKVLADNRGACSLWFPALFCQYLWQLTRLAWKHKKINATYLLSILEETKIV